MPFKHIPAHRNDAPTSTNARKAPGRKTLMILTVGALALTGCGIATTASLASAPSAELASVHSSVHKSTHKSDDRTEGRDRTEKHTAKPTAKPSPSATPSPTPSTTPQPTTSPTAAPSPSPSTAPAPSPTSSPSPSTAPITNPITLPAPAPSGDGTTAAAKFGWGSVVAGDEFNYTGAPDSTRWSVYNSAGHAGNGTRTPSAWSVANGVATVKGDSAGNTGGMSAKFAQQKYGRWETRMRTNARDPQYHPVLILWPNNNTTNKCAEIDYAEGNEETTKMKFFLHYACGGSNFQTTTATTVDTTQWHNYAVEWTPTSITGYIDGVKTFTDTDPSHQPDNGMHQTLQLDWFPSGAATAPSQMQVDWVRVYK
ncbi:hypothetical protein QO003_003639 [Arthrobacter silviterrae]|uniref:glycoside hydrolase family 16 protein n=1 Tax=Arthrobacter TaxID=1663 RepID=UPI001F0E3987|nr:MULTISPECIES: glycoside hydrolase family 16 protein [Arthrobacter]MCU6482357.1 glycoside hydrolase family 16 protein [Arthrobacter sp. A2-55]MDQ0279336.1 hypothetical protein [Arthrobacter silviterrae]